MSIGAPEVSVVMSVYNGASTLGETMRSVLSQEGVELELIVVNDGSSDETPRILDDIAIADARVHVVSQANSGLTIGLIRGCEMARGKYIARQDVGDYSLDGRLLMQKMALDANSELSFVSCWTEVLGPEEEFLSYSKGLGRASKPTHIVSEDAVHPVVDGPSHHGSVMFRREHYLAIGGYRPEFYFGQDWDLWYRLGEIGKFQMIGKVLYQACVTPNSLSGRYRKEQQQISKLSHAMLLRRRLGQAEDDLLQLACSIRPTGSARESTAIEARGLYFIGEQLRRNNDQRAESYFRRALAVSSIFLKPRIRLAQLRLQRMLSW